MTKIAAVVSKIVTTGMLIVGIVWVTSCLAQGTKEDLGEMPDAVSAYRSDFAIQELQPTNSSSDTSTTIEGTSTPGVVLLGGSAFDQVPINGVLPSQGGNCQQQLGRWCAARSEGQSYPPAIYAHQRSAESTRLSSYPRRRLRLCTRTRCRHNPVQRACSARRQYDFTDSSIERRPLECRKDFCSPRGRM